MKLQPRMQALVMSRLGWWQNYLFWLLFLHVTGDQCQLWVGQELENLAWKLFSDAAIRPWEIHVLYNPDGVVKYSVIHCLQLINSAQLCNKKFQSICWSHNAAWSVYHLLCMRLQAVLIPVILEISSMSLNSEASHVSFLNQALLQIENYIKNGQTSFQCNV